jgi:hypothetical protein
MANIVLVIANASAGHLPYVIEPKDADAWQHPEGETRMGEIFIATGKAGYRGIKVDVLGKMSTGKLLWNIFYNTETPEGRMAQGLYALAKASSKLLPVDEALSILERVYREQGLPLPEKKSEHQKPESKMKANAL